MRNIATLLSLFIALVYYLSNTGCGTKQDNIVVSENYPFDRSDTSVVNLQEIEDAKVAIFDTGPVKITLSYSLLMRNLQDFIDKNNVGDDILLLEKLRTMARETDSINIKDICEETTLIDRFQYRLADILEKGAATVYQNDTQEAVNTIIVEHFEYMAHKLAGRGGRRFYLPDRTLFFEIIDWIS